MLAPILWTACLMGQAVPPRPAPAKPPAAKPVVADQPITPERFLDILKNSPMATIAKQAGFVPPRTLAYFRQMEKAIQDGYPGNDEDTRMEREKRLMFIAQWRPDIGGPVEIHCAPAECMVRLNGKDERSTKDGWLTIPELPAGTYTVDFSKPEYISEQRQLKVTALAGAKAPPVVLAPGIEIQRRNGKAALDKLITKLGGAENLGRTDYSVEGTGRAQLHEGARDSSWDLLFRLTPAKPEVYVRFSAAGQRLWYAERRKDADKKFKGTETHMLFDKVAAELEEYHPLTFFAKVAAKATQVLQPPKPGNVLELDLPPSRYRLTLDKDGLPELLERRDVTGFGAGFRVGWANYADLPGGGRYPSSISINHGGTPATGVEVELKTLAPKKLTPKDFQEK